MFHSGLWGNWQYQATKVAKGAACGKGGEDANSTSCLLFGYGGYQEARGSGIKSNHYYVENVQEELDVPTEWFFDKQAAKLYFWPNVSVSLGPASDVAAPMLDTTVRIEGTSASKTTQVSFSGITFTETRATFLEMYEVPSGGDWAIHRGGAVFVQDAEDIAISDCVFNATGGNGLILSKHVNGSTIKSNALLLTGDSVGDRAAGHDRRHRRHQAHVPGGQPRRGEPHARPRHVRQADFLRVPGARCQHHAEETFVLRRAASRLQLNDGFAGGNVIEGNLIFNMVRETGDHGPYNSWDPPALPHKLGRAGRLPGLRQARARRGREHPEETRPDHKELHHQRLQRAIDHDDGSQYMNDTGNLMVWGGCKHSW